MIINYVIIVICKQITAQAAINCYYFCKKISFFIFFLNRNCKFFFYKKKDVFKAQNVILDILQIFKIINVISVIRFVLLAQIIVRNVCLVQISLIYKMKHV